MPYRNFQKQFNTTVNKEKFVYRLFLMRQLGTTLCFIALYPVLALLHYPLTVFILLLTNAFFWPSLAFIYDLYRAQHHKNNHPTLIMDMAFGGIWTAMIGLNPVPSLLILAIQISDRYAACGTKLLLQALIAYLISLFGMWAILGFPLHAYITPTIMWCSIPLSTIYIMVFSMISFRLANQLGRAKKELERLAMTDPRLDIPNRRFFEESLIKSFHMAKQQQKSAYLLLIDVDHFKEVNDHYGHNVGDILLFEISKILRQSIRASTDIVTRYGGDELAIIITHAEENRVSILAQQILDRVKNISLAVDPNFQATVSIGISVVTAEMIDSKEWFAQADIALYKVKRHGRNGFKQYHRCTPTQ